MSVSLNRVVARLVSSSTAHNALNLPPSVPIHMQRSPDFPSQGGLPRGIDGLDFEVFTLGSLIQKGRTGQDGKIDVRVPPGGRSTLQLQFAGKSVAVYEITVETSPLSSADGIRGQQERLRMLGYQIGHANGVDGVDGKASAELERSILDFQADQGELPVAKAVVLSPSDPVDPPLVLDYKLNVQTLTSRAGA